ncbi:MAG: Riboflavin transporter [Pseudomonadota bacterium]
MVARLTRHVRAQPAAVRALLWAAAAGLVFTVLNALMRLLAQQLDPFLTQFLRYFFGFAVLLPWLLRHGLVAYRPQSPGGQFWRGAVHTVGLMLWFAALPHIPLADTTAIGFTTPIFIMLGAWWFLKEPMRWERWAATGIGFAGVLVVLGPALLASSGTTAGGRGSGAAHLLMLASAPVFAASFLITKVLTRSESTGVIVFWQALTVTLFSLPLALLNWQWPTAWQWAGFVLCGALGSGGHYCLTRSFSGADISATQSLKFLELLWAALLGFALFSDVPTGTTLAGGALITAATIWAARREAAAGAKASNKVDKKAEGPLLE